MFASVAVEPFIAETLAIVTLTVSTTVLRASFDGARSTGPPLFTVALTCLLVAFAMFFARAFGLLVLALRAKSRSAIEARKALFALANTVAACTVATAIFRAGLRRVRGALITRPTIFTGACAI